MPRTHLTIASLLLVVVFFGVVFAGLRTASDGWLKLVYMLTFMALVYAAIAARYRSAFWYGFAVAGWAYFLIGCHPWITTASFTQPRYLANQGILTSVVIETVSVLLSGREPFAMVPVWDRSFREPSALETSASIRAIICHCSLTIPFALVGGLVAGAMARRGSAQADDRSDHRTDFSH
jgi:hypothetical protein